MWNVSGYSKRRQVAAWVSKNWHWRQQLAAPSPLWYTPLRFLLPSSTFIFPPLLHSCLSFPFPCCLCLSVTCQCQWFSPSHDTSEERMPWFSGKASERWRWESREYFNWHSSRCYTFGKTFCRDGIKREPVLENILEGSRNIAAHNLFTNVKNLYSVFLILLGLKSFLFRVKNS